ncbi:type II secretion system F family protein [Oceanobacillus piezotolerans]|uniref:type II secretion system F family protein n=1 Tax=Oceanobacillus piezotolerans TaxID=2448030 RepID=UPI001FEB800D|nr:type II secretion system F family protein [Oceanobacillus piezotolerans]
MKIILLTSLFLTIFFFFMAIGLFTASKPIEKEKERSVKNSLKTMNQKLSMLLTKNKKKSKRKNILEQRLSIAGVPIKPEEFIAFRWLSALFTGGLFHLINGNLIILIVGFLIGYQLPALWLTTKEKKRIKEFNNGLPGMITSMVGSLRAGFSLPQSLQMVADESYSPIKEEVELVLKKMRYGTSLEDALLEWKERIPSEDLELMVEAIVIQRQVGGNLAFLLDKIVETIRGRAKIQNQIKTLTAQGRLSGIIISLLPAVLGLIIYFMNPSYIGMLFTNPIGIGMLVAGVVGGIIGFIFIRKITTIEV